MIKNYTHTNRLRGIKQVLACWLCIILAFGAQAQRGGNDPTFNPNDPGYGFGDGHDAYSPLYKSISLPGGKFYILGSSVPYNSVYATVVQRLNSDGSRDTSFHATGIDGQVTDGVLQTDSKLVITGFFTHCNGRTVNHLARLNADGSLDSTFHTGTGLNIPGQGYWPGIALQSDGKIIVEDNAIYDYNGTTIPNLCRINPDGSIDSAYLLNLPVQPYTARGIAILSNGKLMLAGGQRLNTNGTVDSTFNNGGNPNNAGASSIVEQPDHKILLGGSFQTWNGVNVQSIIRIDSLGILDTTFHLGHSYISNCNSLALLPNGKIVAGGLFDTINGQVAHGIVRLNGDGSTDNTFNAGSGIESALTTYFSVNHINLLSSGKMLVVGVWNTFNGTARKEMVMLNADGSIEPTFNHMGSSNGYVYSGLIQSDGKLVFGGNFDSYQNHVAYRIVRTDANGLVDSSFNTNMAIVDNRGPNYTNVWALAQQADGKILAGGSFNNFGPAAARNIGRFNTNGSIDTTFVPGQGADDDIRALAVDANGKILVGGYFTHMNGVAIQSLARLNPDGSLDNTFQAGTGTNGQVYCIKVQPNGKIMVGGYFTTYNGVATNSIVRLNADGTLDTTFALPGGNINVRDILVQSNGKIVVGGYFSYNDPVRNYSFNDLGRFNADGSADVSFSNYAINGGVVSVKLLSDGKYFVAGGFNYPSNNLTVLYPNGRPEHIFQSGSGANQDVDGALQQGNNIIIYGAFTEYDTIGRNRIARISNFCQLPASPHGAVGATICQNNTATISIAAGVGTLGWYSDSLSSYTHIGGGTSYTTDVLYRTTTFYVQDSTCDKSFIRTPVTVVVKNNPHINLSSNLDTVCKGSPETLYISSDSGATFHWSTGATTDSIKVTPTASGYYAVSVTSVNHCLNADSIYVLTYPDAPVVHITQLPSGANIATGGTASASDSYGGNPPADAFDGDTTLTGWGNSGNSLPSWLAYDFGAGHSKVIKAYSFYNSYQMQGGWTSNDYNPVSWTFEGSNDSITWTKLDTIADGHMRMGTISYYVSANNTAYRRYRFNFDYTVDNSYVRLNEVQMFAADTQFCRDANFIASTENFSSVNTYQWKVRGVNAGTNSYYLTLPKVHYGDSISCTVTGGSYCSYPGTASASTIIRSAPNNTTVVNGGTITSNALGANYQWVKCDGATQSKIPGKTGATFTPDSSGTYAVIVIEGSCVDTSLCVSFTKPSGIEAIGADGISLSIYPNPNNGTFMINSSVSGEFSLVDALGQKIQNISLRADVPYQLSNETISSGIYYIIANDQIHVVRNKIVVVKQ